VNDYDSYAEKLQDHSSAPLLCPDKLNSDNYTCCRWAKTVVGIDPLSEKYVCCSVTCKRWGCPYCSQRKIRRLAWMSKNAEPDRLLTLTNSAKDWPDGKTCWETTAPAFAELIRFVRRVRGECEYLRVLELQQNGMPHFHCMLRCGFVPQGLLLKEWRRLTGRGGVNIKRIDQTFATFRYLVKYLTKLHKIEWTDRHVSYSRNFFRAEDREELAYAKLDKVITYEVHPFVWLNERLGWETVKVLGEGKWEIGDHIPDQQCTIDPAKLGLPSSGPALELPSLSQRLIPGTEAPPDEGDHLRPDGRKRGRSRRPVVVSPVNPVPF